MSGLDQWLASEARKQAARPDLPTALLCGRGLAYARQRLGPVALRMSLRSALHALEAYLLVLAFVPFAYIAPLLAFRALAALFAAGHWGALEGLRTRVRTAVARRERPAARAALERWLGLTQLVVLGTGGLLVVLAARALWTTSALELQHAYALACLWRASLDALTRVLHSGIFAVRRVYRPLPSQLAGDLLEVATLALGFDRLGVWALPLAIVLGAALDNALAQVYVRRAYRARRLELPSAWRALRRLARPSRNELAEAGVHALANATLQLDALVLLALAGASLRDSGASAGGFALMFYALRPLMAASSHWARAFYFDLKALERGPLAALRPRFLTFLERLSLGWAGLLALAALGCAVALYGARFTPGLLWIVPFFVVRSALALWQTIAFGAGRGRALGWTGLGVLVGLAALQPLRLAPAPLMAVVCLGLALALAALRRLVSTPAAARASARHDPASFLRWLQAAKAGRLGILTLNPRCVAPAALLAALRHADPELAAVVWGRRQLVIFSHVDSVCSRQALIRTSAGTLQRLWLSEPLSPALALKAAREAGALPEGLDARLRAAAGAPGLVGLESQFQASYASGIRCDLLSGRGGLGARSVRASQVRALVAAIEARSRGTGARCERELPFDIAVYAPGGRARMVFLADKGAADFSEFRSRVDSASLRASWPEAFA